MTYAALMPQQRMVLELLLVAFNAVRLKMQQNNVSAFQDVQRLSEALVHAMMVLSEAELSAPAEAQPTTRHKTLAALILAVQNNLRAFSLVAEEMK